jgi:hypothetical protein
MSNGNFLKSTEAIQCGTERKTGKVESKRKLTIKQHNLSTGKQNDTPTSDDATESE